MVGLSPFGFTLAPIKIEMKENKSEGNPPIKRRIGLEDSSPEKAGGKFVETEASRSPVVRFCNNAGGPAQGKFRQVDHEAWI